jgi:peptide-methionine (R)-S-oxide reductase
MTNRIEKTDEQWRQELTPESYKVLRHKGTERPYTGAYVHTKEDGIYRCAACEAELFSSDTKFNSGTGWPSFTDPANRANVELHEDRSHAPHRGDLRDLRRAPGPRLQRRPGRLRPLLHQLRRPQARPDSGQVAAKGTRVGRRPAPSNPASGSSACRPLWLTRFRGRPTAPGRTREIPLPRAVGRWFVLQRGHGPVEAPACFQSGSAWNDMLPFHEYFHGDTGAGLGASQQTGLVADLMIRRGRRQTPRQAADS